MSVEIWDEKDSDSPPFHCGCCGVTFERVGLEIPTDRGSPASRDDKMHLCLSCADEITAAAAEARGRDLTIKGRDTLPDPSELKQRTDAELERLGYDPRTAQLFQRDYLRHGSAPEGCRLERGHLIDGEDTEMSIDDGALRIEWTTDRGIVRRTVAVEAITWLIRSGAT